MSVDVNAVIQEHLTNSNDYQGSGSRFVEGPDNENPWGPEQGVSNAAYCESGAETVAYHHGYRWWPESQFGERGDAYTPYGVVHGEAHGETVFDHASDGKPADVLAGDELFYAWNNGAGPEPDHVETAIEDCPSNGRTHNVGYNTGQPNGSVELWRDRTFLLCRRRPVHYRDDSPGPVTPPAPAGPRDLRKGYTGDDVRALQQRLSDLGYDVPGGIDGDFGSGTEQAVMNFQNDWAKPIDGFVGKATREALADDSHRANTAPPPPPAPSAPAFPAWPGVYLQRGDVSDSVRVFQEQLKDGRGWNLDVDGWFGVQTRQIVVKFQQEKGLEVDGIVGPSTWGAFWTSPVT